MWFILLEGFWLWAFVILFCISEFWWIERESGWGASISFFTVFLALVLFSDLGIWAWVADHPWNIVVGIFGYFVIGVGWGVFKWFLYVKERAEDYREKRKGFLRKHEWNNATLDSKVPENLRHKWEKETNKYFDGPPQPNHNKTLILVWMSYWPWSVSWTALRDPFRHAYTAIASKLENISNSVFKDAGWDEDRELSKPEDE